MRLVARILLHNWPLKATSVGLAIILWLYVLVITNPWTVREIDCPVDAQRVTEGLQVMSITPPSVRVSVAGRRRRVDHVAAGVLRAIAGLANRAIGEHEVPVVVPMEELPRGVRVVGVAHYTVVVSLDRTVEQNRAVQVSIRGRSAPGFQAVGQDCHPNEVAVSGPQSVVQAVARTVAVVDISGIDANRTFSCRIEARDARDMPQSGVKITPGLAEVAVRVARVNTKTVPVVLGEVTVPPGTSIESLDLSPQVVTVTGDPVALAELRLVRTGPVRFAAGDTVARATLQLPRGVVAVDEDSVRVALQVANAHPARLHRGATPTPEEAPAAPGATPPAEPEVPPAETPPPPVGGGGPAPSHPRGAPPPGGEPPTPAGR